MDVSEITTIFKELRAALSRRCVSYAHKNLDKNKPDKSNVLFETLFNFTIFEYKYCMEFKTSTKEFFETKIILESFLYLKIIHSILHNRYQLNKLLKAPTKDELIDQKFSELRSIIDEEKLNIEDFKDSIKIKLGTYIPDELPKDKINELIIIYRKNKYFLDYAFYINMKHIFSRYRKNYWKDLIEFLQIVEVCFPSSLDVHFDLHYSEVENLRNRFRGYEKKLPSEIANITEFFPLKF